MKKTSDKQQQDVKVSYEPVHCKVAEVKPQGVLCTSSGQSDDQLTGGLSNYTGSEL